MATSVGYPITVEARLDPQLSRWLWLVKWFLAIPHYFVLTFLWIAFLVLSVIAFFSILITGRYPRGIFDFNVGVLRWSWRVGYYAYSALGTDRYPPFTLAEVSGYPTHLDITYPERLSRGLVLVKWWLLALPHYLIVGVLMGGTWIAWRDEAWAGAGLRAGTGLIGLLVLIAAIALATTGRYPRGLFDLILGLNRWVLRVAAYAGLMTDAYPPFRLDMGGSESSGTLTVPPSTPRGGMIAEPHRAPRRGWTAGGIVSVVVGALLTLMAIGLLSGGGVILWTDRSQRDASGFLSTPTEDFSTDLYAIVADGIELRGAEGFAWTYPPTILDEARVRVRASARTEVFVGIAPADDAARYLQGVGYAATKDLPEDPLVTRPGGGPPSQPIDERFWVASSVGKGTQTVEWPVEEGSWTVVVMNADGSPGLQVQADVGATLPILPRIATWLLVVGSLALLAGATLLGGAIYLAMRAATT